MSTAAKARMLTVVVEEAPLEEVVTVGAATAVAEMPEAERVPALVTVVIALLKVAASRETSVCSRGCTHNIDMFMYSYIPIASALVLSSIHST